jgi:cytochrome P450
MELQEAIGAITRRLPALRLAVPEEEIQWTTESITVGPVALPVTW